MKKVKNPKKKKSTTGNKLLRWFWLLFIGGVLSVVLLFACANWGVFGAMPTFDELENPSSSVATEIISADGKTLGKFYLENRVPVKDRKSTRLNSSHVRISYAVFCLKKK